MTLLADIFGPCNTHLAAAFADSEYTVLDRPPDTTRLPAVWFELASGRRQGRTNVVTVRVVAVVADLENGPTADDVVNVVDRLADAWVTPPPGLAGGAWSWTLQNVTLGGVDHTAISFEIPLEYPNTC